jgi:tungstate transport system ATP-binding protein
MAPASRATGGAPILPGAQAASVERPPAARSALAPSGPIAGRCAAAPSSIVELAEVRVVYGGRPVVDIEHLAVRAGEVLAIMGPNGSGKSTLLRVLGLLEAPTMGRVRFRGEAVAPRDLLAARRQMASVFQDPSLVDATAFENVALGLRFRGLTRTDFAPRVGQWMDRFGIAHLARRRARTLSGGEAQRAALARALVLEPALLLLDEPFSALDQPTREALIGDLGRILRQERITTVLVTHDRGEALALGDRVGAMMDGRILQIGDAARLFRAPASEAVARFVGVETIVDGRITAVRDGLLTLAVGGQPVEVASGGQGRVGAPVRLCVRPEDVTLCMPGDAALGSAQNWLPGTIARLLPAGTQVRVLIDCGFPLVAQIAHRAVEEMALVEGMPVVAGFKASAAHVIPRS